MIEDWIFNFNTDISAVDLPNKINNPFSKQIPAIAKIAAKEFTVYLDIETKKWEYDFSSKKGKMFGILAIQKEDNSVAYLGAVSGKIPIGATINNFIPSVFNDSADDFFINKGMLELTELSTQIENVNIPFLKSSLKENRKQKSIELQTQLFKHYNFLNLSRKSKNIIEIFKQSSQGNPPSAAGECAAPKLLNFAFANQLKPIAIAEFWYGNSDKKKVRKHKEFYPACKNKCKPILEFMLEDSSLYANSIT